MGLNAILKTHKDKPKTHVQKDIELFLPPEYDLDLDTWRAYIQQFNTTERQARLSLFFIQFIQDREPTKKNFDNIISISEILEIENRFYTNVYFENDRAGLTAMLLFKAENLILAPICKNKEEFISHISMMYRPPL